MLKKFFSLFIPTKNSVRIFIYMIPAVLIGWWLFPIAHATYVEFIMVCMLIGIWEVALDIRDKLK